MASYTGTGLDGLPSIYRNRGREVWKLEESTEAPLGQQRTYFELQDQLRTQREELRRKDELIRGLTIGDRSGPMPAPPCISARGEVAALQAKVETLSCRLHDRQLELEAAGDTIVRLRGENERLREMLGDCEATRSSYDAVRSRSSHAVASLQEQLRVSQERVRELEYRINSNAAERERAESDKTGIERRYSEFANRVIYHLGTGSAEHLDGVVDKVSELVQENVMMKSKIHSLTDQVGALELEGRSNKETIQRLLAEVNKEHRAQFLNLVNQTDFKTEAERLEGEKADLEKQVELLESRLEATKGSLEATKGELGEKEAQVAKLECERLEAMHSSQSNMKQMQAFIESLASLLSTAYCHVAPSEEAVKEKVKLLCREVKEHAASVSTLEERVRSVTQQFEQQFETNREKESRVRRTETEHFDMRERIRALESELAAGDVIRDGLKADKEKFYKYMRRLAEIMRMDYAAIDVGFDLLADGLLSRAEQLVRHSGAGSDDFIDGNLQRKLRSMKEQMESKDLHLELLRKKVASLEANNQQQLMQQPQLQQQNAACNYKLQRHLEKSQAMLEDARQEIADLRAQLMQCSSIKAAAIGQNRDITVLESTMEKLERVRQKQAKKIAMLKAEVEARDRQFGDKRLVTDSSLQGLSNEVKATRKALEESRLRERQLQEFRATVARMLGLAADTYSVGNDEVIARLDRLIQSQQRGQFTAFSEERQLRRMDGSFQDGYEQQQQQLRRSRGRDCAACVIDAAGPRGRGEELEEARGRSRDSRRFGRRSGSRQRTRSVSPMRDNRRY